MEIIRAGVDSLYLAVKGTLPAVILAELAKAKVQAVADRNEIAIELGGEGIKAMVPPGGHPGGYSFVFDTGPIGARFACREKSDRPDWNLFIKPHATALLALGFQPVVQMVLNVLAGIGGSVIEISVNRIDYAMDIRNDGFEIDPYRFVAHPKTKLPSRWNKKDEHRPAFVLAGRRVESMTIGKLPGKQVILYDKTAEARSKQALYWFEAWRLDPRDPNVRVWRLELRLGRNALRNIWRLRGLDDLRAHLHPALSALLEQVRYIRAGETDANVSRRRVDPIWEMAKQHIEEADLLGETGQLHPMRLLEITQAMMIACHEKLIVGNAASLAAVMNLDDETIEDQLPQLLAEKIQKAIPTTSFNRSITRARQRRNVILRRNRPAKAE